MAGKVTATISCLTTLPPKHVSCCLSNSVARGHAAPFVEVGCFDSCCPQQFLYVHYAL